MRPPTGLAAAAEPAGGSPASRGSSPIPAARAGTSPVPTATVAPTAGATADGPQGPGGKGKGAMGIKELRSQPSLRRQLQRWRSMRWLSRADINLDDSISQTLLAGGGRWWQRVWRWRRSPRAIAALVVLLAVLAVAGVLLADAARLLPCIKPGATCFNLALAEFQDICDFESLPVRLTTTAFLPPLYSRLHVKEAGFEVGVRGSGQPPVGSCFFDERNAVSSMVLTGGTQNLTIDTTLHVTNGTGMGMIFSLLLNEVDFQVVINTKIKVEVETPLKFKIPVAMKSDFFLTCAHLPCAAAACKYVCQFGDYPMKDPDASTPFPYVTRVEKVRLGYDEQGVYTISPEVHVWLSEFRAATVFPRSIVDLYFYNHTVPGRGSSGFRERADLDEDHKLFQVTMHPFVMQSLEASGGEPFLMKMDMRAYNDTPGQAATARDFTTRFLRKDPLYMYLAATPVDKTCPKLRGALLTVPPAGLSLNTNSSTKDGSDSSFAALSGPLTDVFRVNSVDLFSLNNSILRSFVNVTLMLPFALEGELPTLDMDGFAGADLMGHFRALPLKLPPVQRRPEDLRRPPLHSFGKEKEALAAASSKGTGGSKMAATLAAAPVGETTVVMFTEAELSPWGVARLETIFPDFLARLEELDIDLVGSPAPEGNVVQQFLSGVTIKLASLEDGLISRDKAGQAGRLFFTPEGSPVKPRVHLEVKSITYEHSHDSGLLAYVNFTYPQAFQGRFDIRGGSMHFLLADDNSTALATVTVLDSILSRELTHLEAEIFIADYMQAEAVHNVIDSYSKEFPTGLKILDGVVDTAMALKQQVPVDYDMLAAHCAEDVESFCPGLGPDETRDCLNQEFGSRVLSHECLKVILPRGALDLQIPNLSRFVDVGRGIANGVMERMESSASKVAVNLVEVLSLRTPEEPMDLQMILDQDKSHAPEGTQVEVRARTNLSIGLLDAVDLTYTVPPVAIGIAAPISAADAAANQMTSLFTLAIPAMDKALPRGPLLVESTVRIANIYHATAWLEGLMADLQDKYVVAQPLNTGDVWSYMVEPLRLKINVLAAINSTTQAEEGAPAAAPPETTAPAAAPATILKQSPNETWSKILFRAASYPDVIVTETKLAFSRPWTEAIDVRIPAMKMSVFTSFVEADGGNRATPILTDATLCTVDPQRCHLGHFKAGTFRTTKGAHVTVDTNLNMTATDDGRFWATVLSDYVAGARVGLWLKTEKPEATFMASSDGGNGGAGGQGPGQQGFEMDASIILPKLPPLNIPLNDLVNEVGQLTRRALATRGDRRLSLAEIWASLDPIILSVTQPVSVKVDTIRLCNFESRAIDPLNASSISLGADLVARSVVTIPDILEVDLRIPPLSMNIFSGSLADLAAEEQRLGGLATKDQQADGMALAAMPLALLDPWAAARVSEFVYDSKRDNTSETALHAELHHVKRALDVAETVLSGGRNVTITVAGAPEAGMEAALFSRIFSHMRVQLDLSSRPPAADGGKDDAGAGSAPSPKRGPEERLFVAASVSSTAEALVVDADVYVPRAMNPLAMTILAGAMDLTLSLAGGAASASPVIARIAVDPVKLSQEADSSLGLRMEVSAGGLQTVLEVLERVKARQTAELVLDGTLAAQTDLPHGRFHTSLQLTPELAAKWGLFEDGRHVLRLALDEVLNNPRFPFHLDNVGLVGGDELGSEVKLPCLLKGWCDGGLTGAGVGRGGKARLKAVVAATVTRLSEFLGLDDGFLAMSLGLPAVAFRVDVDPTAPSLGRVSLDATTINIRDGTQLSLVAGAELWDLRGLQATAFRLWEAPFTATLVGDAEGRPDVLSRLLAALPVAVEVPGPASPTEAILSLRTLPTVCDGRWTIEKTTAAGFTARVELPHVTAPVPLTLDHFAATVLYKGSPVLEASTREGSLYVGPTGGTRVLLVDAVGGEGGGGGDCPYKTTTPGLCLLGEALGKIMTFGDSGAFEGELVVSFLNPWLRDRLQTVRMPIQLYGGGAAQPLPQLWHGALGDGYTPPPPKSFAEGGKEALQCAAAHEMVQDLYINLEDTVGASLQFWKTVEVALKVFMVNIFAFPLEVGHLRLNMFFRDPDGVPESRPSFLSYPPSYDYCLLHEAELPTPGLVIPPGQGQWTPLLRPRMDETRLMESLARLFDEVVMHKRLCADMLDSVIGVTIRSAVQPGDEPFVIDMPVSIRSIPFYDPHACATAESMKADGQQQQQQQQQPPQPPQQPLNGKAEEPGAGARAEPAAEVVIEAAGPVLGVEGAARRLRSQPHNK